MSQRFEKVEQLFHQALEKPVEERSAFLLQACPEDEALRKEVESLLGMETQAGPFLEVPALEVASRDLAGGATQMPVGKVFGAYLVLSALGRGGMGEVYLARDTRLGRKVALKILPAAFNRDAERMRRFLKEAQAAAALNHPNVAQIYEIEEAGDLQFIAMEYVQGKRLDQLIPRKGQRLDEALKLAIQMADALAAAHRAGIVHRDLKPGNVMVTDNGQVKVLDFGLAKLLEKSSASGLEETETLGAGSESLTEEGVILGTVAYMSPEQAEGKKLDARSDIFSFGSVLYEMVTGRKAFEGDSKLSTLGAILKQEPRSISQLVSGIPHDMEKIINRCLRKDPALRFQHMDDVKVELGELKEESDSGKLAGTAGSRPASQCSAFHGRRIWVWAGAALVVVAIVVVAWSFRGTARKQVTVPEVFPLTSYAGFETSSSFSPDGNQVVFSWNGEKQDNFDIYVKLIGSPTPVRLTTDPAEDISPAFSPDGRSIGFVRVSGGRRALIIIPAIGGPERFIAEIAGPSTIFDQYGRLFDWFPDGKWVVTPGLALLSTENGQSRSLTLSKSSPDFSPAVSPDGRAVVFSRSSHFESSDIYLLDLTRDMMPNGQPRRLTSRKGFSLGSAWTSNGQEIIFHTESHGAKTCLWRLPVSGAGEPEPLPFTSEATYRPAISRSGNRLAYEQWVEDSNIWHLSLSGPGMAAGPPTRLIGSTRLEQAAQYSPDGKRIAFESERSGIYGIWVSDADGSNVVELFSRAGAAAGTPRWSPDGQRLAFDCDLEGNFGIYVIRASGGQPIRVTDSPAGDTAPSWSRDGRWVYFTSTRTGRSEVWKVPAGSGKAIQVTRNGGETAFESTDSKFIYYVKGDFSGSLWRLPLTGGDESLVLPSVNNRAFYLVDEGIYFIPEPGANGKSSIQFLNFATTRVKTVATMSAPPAEGLSVSPDGRFILFSQSDESGSDLMLVEGFK